MVYDDSEIAIINIEIDPQSLSWIFDSANLESDSMHVASVHFQNAISMNILIQLVFVYAVTHREMLIKNLLK